MFLNQKRPKQSVNKQLETDQVTKFNIPRTKHNIPSLEKIIKHKYKVSENSVLVEGNKIYFGKSADMHSSKINFEQWNILKKQIKVHQWKYIQQIALYKRGFSSDHQFVMTIFGRQFQTQFPALKKLTVSFQTKSILQSDALIFLERNISHCSSTLNHLSLKLFLTQRKNEEFRAFGSRLFRSLTSLHSLDLSLISSHYITEDSFKAFMFQICRSLPKLKHLALRLFEFLGVNDTIFGTIGSLLNNRLKCLKTFKLDISDCVLIDSTGLRKFFSSIQNPLFGLKNFLFRFNKIKDDQLEELGSCLSEYFPSLKNFYLDLSECKSVTSRGLKAFACNFADRLASLENISINFVDQFFTDFLLEFENLKSLDLYYYNCHFPEHGLKYLGSEILPRLVNLTQLTLHFFNLKNTCDDDISILAYNLTNSLGKLTHLTLEFKNCQKITGIGLQKLNLSNLKQLCLNFSATNINDEGLAALASKIKAEFTNLEKLSIIFKFCSEISDAGLAILASKIASLTGLQELTLNFQGCAKVTKKCWRREIKV